MIERLVRWSLGNRPVIYALSLLLTLGGLVLALRTPVDVLPDLTAPTVTVVVDAGGYTPTEVEQRVTIPLETALNGSPGLRRIRSNSATGLSVVTLEFGWATSPAEARRITSERLQTVGDELPEDLPAPHMTPASSVMGEIMFIALRSPEPIAAMMAVPMTWLAAATKPVVWFLDSTSALVFRLLGLNRESEDQVTAEELHLIVAEASKSGVIEEHERSIISGVVRLADRPVREVMTPRTEVDWLDVGLDEAAIRAAVLETSHSRLPVAEGSIDAVIGVVQARDIAAALFRGEALDLAKLARKAPVVVDQIDAMDALDALRRAEVPMALIHDEYGHFEGIVTPANLLAAIAGEFASDADEEDGPSIVERDDGSLLVAGTMAADLLAERLGIDLPEDRDYATVAGLALAVLRRLPAEGESFVEQGWRFEVVDLDGRRIDKLLVSRA